MAAPADNPTGADRRVVIGRVSGLYGVMGWVKVFSYTRPKENILDYSPWLINLPSGWRSYRLEQGRSHGKGLIARVEGVSDREGARALMGCDIAVTRRQLPEPEQGEYYWCDLIGLDVVNREGLELGSVVDIEETGANDVLIVEGRKRCLIPFVAEKFVKAVDLNLGRIVVDWDPMWMEES